MKTAPVIDALRRRGVEHVLVHTGQHYDRAMSQVFFEELGIEAPQHDLRVGSGTHAQMTARVMERLEPVLEHERPDAVLVPGDVNSTLAAALTATKLVLPVGHVEAGLRSFDRSMPEEVNRVLTDAVSTWLFTHSPEAEANLLREGAALEAIHPVGNTMIDTLVRLRDRIDAAGREAHPDLPDRGFVVTTLHRPALTDGPLLAVAVEALRRVAAQIPVLFPIHPRTLARCREQGVALDGLRVVEPLGYLEFVGLVARARAVLTDSGGVQEETTFLGVPCFTLRDNTERPITVEQGTNVLLGLAPERIAELPELLAGAPAAPAAPAGWDGRAGERIADVLARR